MANATTQIKFTIESGLVSEFRARCAGEGVSMTSAIRRFMGGCAKTGIAAMDVDTRPRRRKAAGQIIGLLESVLRAEEEYRDAIPEQFEQRREASDMSCECLSEAIERLSEAYQ